LIDTSIEATAEDTRAEKVSDEHGPWNLYSQRARRVFLSVLFLVGASNYVDRNIVSVLLEQIKAEFRVSDTMLGLMSGLSFALLYATVGIPVARWADRRNRVLVITLSLSIWSVMTACCGLSNTFWQLAAARFGVGAGEAGAIPPAQSLLADYYPPTQRARAIGIFMMSSSVGYVIGLVLGGFVAQTFGWRLAFLFVGLGGIALTPLTGLLLEEPRLEPRFAIHSRHGESMLGALAALIAKPAYRNILAAIVVYFIMAYGALVFVVSLMMRTYGLSVSQAGATFGAISAIGAVVGSVGGGALADRLATRDLAWSARVAALGMIMSTPFYELAFSAQGVSRMAPVLLLATTLLTAAVPAMFSSLHVVCGTERRALSVAVVFFFSNLIGLGLGPLITGMLSDRLAAVLGAADGLRYSMMLVTTVLLLSGGLMLRAARYLKRDAED
jgi:predicted MFS family arabinose efflux permease